MVEYLFGFLLSRNIVLHLVPYFDPVLQVHIHVVSLTTSQEGAYVIDNRSSLNKRLHSKSFVNHIFAFLLAGSTLLLYIATLFPLNQFDTSFLSLVTSKKATIRLIWKLCQEFSLLPLNKLQNAVVLEGLEMKVIFGGSGSSLCPDGYPYVFRCSNGNLHCCKVNSESVCCP